MKNELAGPPARPTEVGPRPLERSDGRTEDAGERAAVSESTRLHTLHEISLLINAAQTREEILGVVRRESKWVVPAELTFLCLLDKSRTRYTVGSLSASFDESPLNEQEFPLSEGLPGLVIRNQSPLMRRVTPGSTANDVFEEELSRPGIRALLLVPLRTGDLTIGALGFGSGHLNVYPEQDVAIAQMLASQMAIALQSMTMLDDVKRRIAQIELVNELSGTLTSTLDLSQLLHTAVETIRKTFSYFDVTLLFVDQHAGEVYLVAHAGVHADFLPAGYRQKISDGVIGWVAAHGQLLLVNDVREEPRFLAYTYRATRSELAIPIKVGQEIIGVLNVEADAVHAFDETDVTVLEILCDQLGVAIKNAQLYDELKKSNAKLTELDRMKSDFLGIVSHDFRSPLASIVLAGQALLRRSGPFDQQRVNEYLQVIVDQATRLNYLAEDTLSIAKLESGQLSYHFNIVNLDRLIRDAAALVNFTGRHTFECSVDPAVAFARGDQAKLRQVVQNLLTNAVKYSPRGGSIRVRAKAYTEDQVVVSVQDEGIGIPADQSDRLFRKFSRINTESAREIKGSGLGLWICREIVRAHGGTIWVESTEEKGSTFSFTLKKAEAEQG